MSFLLLKFFGVSPFLNIKLLHWAATYWILGNIPLECRRLSIDYFRKSSQNTTQNPKRRRPSYAEDGWFFRHQSKTYLSMNDFPSQLSPFQRSHLVHTQIEHLFQREICRIRDGMTTVSITMNIAYSNVTHISPLHNMFSSFSATFIVDRFCLFRTESFHPFWEWSRFPLTNLNLFHRFQWQIAVALLLFEGSQWVAPFYPLFLRSGSIHKWNLVRVLVSMRSQLVFPYEAGLNIEDGTLRERMEANMDFKFQNCHIPLWNQRRRNGPNMDPKWTHTVTHM